MTSYNVKTWLRLILNSTWYLRSAWAPDGVRQGEALLGFVEIVHVCWCRSWNDAVNSQHQKKWPQWGTLLKLSKAPDSGGGSGSVHTLHEEKFFLSCTCTPAFSPDITAAPSKLKPTHNSGSSCSGSSTSKIFLVMPDDVMSSVAANPTALSLGLRLYTYLKQTATSSFFERSLCLWSVFHSLSDELIIFHLLTSFQEQMVLIDGLFS